VRGDRAYVSDPEPLNPDGSITGPFGKVGVELRWSKATRRLG
jgi:hypothetical protein